MPSGASSESWAGRVQKGGGVPIAWKAGEDENVSASLCTHQRRTRGVRNELHTGIESPAAEAGDSQGMSCDR